MNKDRTILTALAAPSTQDLIALINKGHGLEWRDDAGKTLLHLAAARGHEDVVSALLQSGADVFARDNNGDTPRDLALIMGHRRAAQITGEVMQAARDPLAAQPLPFNNLDALRGRDQQDFTQNLFNAAQTGRFAQVVAFARAAQAQGQESLRVEDLTAQAQPGCSILLKLCETGQARLLLDPVLWAGQGGAFHAAWKDLPKAYTKDLPYDRFRTALQQQMIRAFNKGSLAASAAPDVTETKQPPAAPKKPLHKPPAK